MKAQRIRVAGVKVSSGLVQAVTFVARKKAVVVRTKGLPKIKVTPHADGKGYFAQQIGGRNMVQARGATPAKAFARAAKNAWA